MGVCVQLTVNEELSNPGYCKMTASWSKTIFAFLFFSFFSLFISSSVRELILPKFSSGRSGGRKQRDQLTQIHLENVH